LYYDVDVTPEEETELIEQVARKIHEYGMEAVAILFLESSKPLVWIGGEMGRFFISPFVPILSEDWGVKSEKFFLIFEKRENIDRLLKRCEELAQEEAKKKSEEKAKKGSVEQETAPPKETGLEQSEAGASPEPPETELGKEEKKGWRKYLPF
jgi:hypothetical protein